MALDMNKTRDLLISISKEYGYTLEWHGKCLYVNHKTGSKKTSKIAGVDSPEIYVAGILLDRTTEEQFKKDCHRAFSK